MTRDETRRDETNHWFGDGGWNNFFARLGHLPTERTGRLLLLGYLCIHLSVLPRLGNNGVVSCQSVSSVSSASAFAHIAGTKSMNLHHGHNPEA